MARPEREAVALLAGSGMGPVLAQVLRPLAAEHWALRRVHHRPGAGVSAVFDVAARDGRRPVPAVVCVSTASPPEDEDAEGGPPGAPPGTRCASSTRACC